MSDLQPVQPAANRFKGILRTSFDYRKYSRLGIASFIIALITSLVVIADISLALNSQNDPQALRNLRTIDLWLTWLMLALAVSGIILGLAATLQTLKKRLFGVVGLVFNSLFLVAIVGLYTSNLVAFWSLAR